MLTKIRKRIIYLCVSLSLIVLALGICLWPNDHSSTQLPTSVQARTPAFSVALSPASPNANIAVKTANKSPHFMDRLLENAIVLEQAEGITANAGHIKSRLWLTKFKNPTIQTEEYTNFGPDGQEIKSKVAYVANHLIVQVSPQAPPVAIQTFLQENNSKIKRKLLTPGFLLIEFGEPSIHETARKVEIFKNRKDLFADVSLDLLMSH